MAQIHPTRLESPVWISKPSPAGTEDTGKPLLIRTTPFSDGLDIKTNPSGSGHHQNHILTQLFFSSPLLEGQRAMCADL